ncbi:hypothetical protein ONZ51_g12168 [Trametes cubensis]|uniref:SUN domain-containing protein n=1 Tax=Trametes cubensis TaxID=1111947 RepID=A0AAD7X3P3_9APHY|nr:hypothetical protein ONZ51_g12168 [Trametes cubensis]
MSQLLLVCGLILSWLLAIWHQLRKPPHLPRMASYTFSARAPIRHGKTTYLEFTAPSPPHTCEAVRPTILQALDTYNVVEARTDASNHNGGHAGDADQDAHPRERKLPVTVLKTEQAPRPSSRSSVLRIVPILRTRTQNEPPATPVASRITRSVSKLSLKNVSLDSQLEPEPEVDLPFIKRETKPHTAFFSSSGPRLLSSPPVLRNQDDVKMGDVFCHKTADSIQLWLRSYEGGNCVWRKVDIGYERNDGRRLSITKKLQNPSWVGTEWCGKRISAHDISKSVRFEPGDVSFSENAPQRANPHGRKPQPRNLVGRRKLLSLSNILVILPVCTLAVALVYKNVPLPPLSNLWDGFVSVSQQIFVAGPNTSDAPTPPTHACSSPTFAFRTDETLVVAARWGPALRLDYALSANGGKIVLPLTSSERPRRRSLPATPGPEVVINEDSSIGSCWTVGVSGQVGISTSAVIYPTHVTVEHIPRQIAMDIGRAPRRLILWGVVDGLSNVHKHRLLMGNHKTDLLSNSPLRSYHAPPLTDNHAFVALAEAEYDISDSSPVQTFAVDHRVVESRMDFGIFVLEIVDNWGGSDTCLYRVQIHGEAAPVDIRRE